MTWKSLSLALILLLAFVPACSDDMPTEPTPGPEFEGTFTIFALGDPEAGSGGNAFEHLVDVPIPFSISTSALTDLVRHHRASRPAHLEVTVQDPAFSFTGDPTGYLQETVAPNLKAASKTLELGRHVHTEEILINDAFEGTPDEEYFSFGVFVFYDGTIDAEGVPLLTDFTAVGEMYLSRHAGDQPTDSARGTLTLSLRGVSEP